VIAWLLGAALASEPTRVVVPEVGQVWQTTAPSVLSTGYGVDVPVAAPGGPTGSERQWSETFPPEWAPGPSNPHGGYHDVAAGALVECVAVSPSAEPWEIVTVVWYAHADDVVFRETYATERAPSTFALVDQAVVTDEAATFDAKAWKRARKGHPGLAEWVARP